MKAKSLVFSFVLALASLTSQAEYLYWMLDGSVNNQSGCDKFQYATMSINGTDVLLMQSATPEPGPSPVVLVKTEAGQPLTENPWYADITGYGDVGSVFLLELYGENDQRVAWTTVTLDQTMLDSYIYRKAGDPVPKSPFTSWGTIVPEPTSGLLVLLGVAGLALRRKRA